MDSNPEALSNPFMGENDERPTGRAALVLLDLQPIFLNTIGDGETVLRRCCFAAEAARLLGLSVLLTQQVPEKLGTLHAKIAEAAGDAPVIDKSTFSAMRSGKLAEDILTAQEIDHLLIGGVETPICVYQTAIEAMSEQYAVTLLSDCLGCRRPADGDAALTYLAAENDCHLLPTETVFYSLLGSADHPKFREFSELVKRYR